jgi:hypothetical protein
MNESIVDVLHGARRRAKQTVEADEEKVFKTQAILLADLQLLNEHHDIVTELDRAYTEAKEES